MGATLTDDFNRADGPLGAAWTTANGNPLIVISSYFGTDTSDPANPAFAKFNTPITTDDWDVTATTNVAGRHAAGFYVRCLSGASLAQGYGCEIRDNGASGLKVSVMRLDSGLATYLLFEQVSAITNGGVDHNLRMVLVGSKINVYLDGVFQTTQTDTTYTSGKYMMLGTEFNDCGFNSFLATEAQAPSPRVAAPVTAVQRATSW